MLSGSVEASYSGSFLSLSLNSDTCFSEWSLYRRLLDYLAIGRRYPKIIRQSLPGSGVLCMEVTNEVEEWRVESLDEEQDFLEELIGSLRPDDVLYDVGACIGLYSLHAAHHCRKVYAFEPDPGFLRRIARNIQLNGVTNITVFPLAVSDRSGEVSLFTDGVDGRSPSLANLGQRDAVLVPCESLDHMLAAGRIDPPNVIKMDIEGAEFLALSGARTLLESENRPRAIFLEVHPHYLVKFGHTITELEQFLINCGYREEKRRVRDIQYHVILRA